MVLEEIMDVICESAADRPGSNRMRQQDKSWKKEKEDE